MSDLERPVIPKEIELVGIQDLKNGINQRQLKTVNFIFLRKTIKEQFLIAFWQFFFYSRILPFNNDKLALPPPYIGFH